MPAYFLGSLNLFQKLKPPASELDTWAQQRLNVAAAPVLDLMELSGYAKLLAELYGKEEVWTSIRTSWDVYLENMPDALPWLAAVARFGEPSLQIPHRGMLRTNWEMRVQSELRKLPRRRVIMGGMGIHFDEIVEHRSPLVRYAAENEFLRGKEIFVGLYLATQPGAQKVDWGRMSADLNESLRREEEEYNDDENPDEASK